MIIKSSKNKSYRSLFLLIILTVFLWIFSLFNKTEKEPKYPDAPKSEQKTPLDFIQITINEKNYKKLKSYRDKAIALGHLESENKKYVPASITFNGKKYKADIRLKGDWTDHLQGKKWSFRVKLKGNNAIYGMRRFSLHHPKTRGYLNEWLYHKANKKENLIAPRYEFVEGSIHIKKKDNSYIDLPVGIYAIEETFDKLLIESNKRKESIILKFSEDYFWNEIRKGLEISNEYGVKKWLFTIGGVKYPVRIFSESKYLKDSVYRGYFKLSKYLINEMNNGEIPVSSGFDSKKLAMHNALLNLFGALHGSYIINERFYYNPITSKLEPISFDGNSGKKLYKYVHFNLFKNYKQTDSIYLKDLLSAINKISNPGYLKQLIDENKTQLEFYKKILTREFKVPVFNKKNLVFNQKNVLKKGRDTLNYIFNNIKPIKIDVLKIKDISQWRPINITLLKTTKKFLNKPVYHLKRTDQTKPSYIVIDKININYYTKYQVSIIVKKGEKGNHLGLRIQGNYPDRVDGVFDINNGKIIGMKSAGSFKTDNINIEDLGNGWYRCILSGLIDTTQIKILMGPTDEKSILAWERALNKPLDVYVVPQSLTLDEL